MTSLEIAEVTGKQHKHVMRDIRVLIEQGVNQLNFGLVEYTDKKGGEKTLLQADSQRLSYPRQWLRCPSP